MTRRTTACCTSPEATATLAGALASLCTPGLVVALVGGLGAGKTTFAKAYASALGVTSPVTSPSYALVHHYRCAPGAPVAVLAHADLWRLESKDELGDLDLDGVVADGAALLVEWGDRFGLQALPAPPMVVELVTTGPTTREVTVDLAGSALGDESLDVVAAQ